MSTAIRDPWQRLSQLTREMDRAFDLRPTGDYDDDTRAATADWVPAVDIKEEQNRFVIYADVPGVDLNDIEITLSDGVLIVRGERESQSLERREDFKRMERRRGSFYRRFVLPDTADVDNISARGTNGALEIIIPKLQRAYTVPAGDRLPDSLPRLPAAAEPSTTGGELTEQDLLEVACRLLDQANHRVDFMRAEITKTIDVLQAR